MGFQDFILKEIIRFRKLVILMILLLRQFNCLIQPLLISNTLFNTRSIYKGKHKKLTKIIRIVINGSNDIIIQNQEIHRYYPLLIKDVSFTYAFHKQLYFNM